MTPQWILSAVPSHSYLSAAVFTPSGVFSHHMWAICLLVQTWWPQGSGDFQLCVSASFTWVSLKSAPPGLTTVLYNFKTLHFIQTACKVFTPSLSTLKNLFRTSDLPDNSVSMIQGLFSFIFLYNSVFQRLFDYMALVAYCNRNCALFSFHHALESGVRWPATNQLSKSITKWKPDWRQKAPEPNKN